MATLPNIIRRVSGPKPRSFQVISSIPSIRKIRRDAMLKGESVGFVPTMGALHQGHLALIRQAVQENKHVYVSIYVNPTQFGVNEDFDSYPNTLDSDLEQLRPLTAKFWNDDSIGQITAVFTPTTSQMYPGLKPSSEIDGPGSFVTITPLSSVNEGASRPVFFRGVATVCMKLFNIVQPDNVYFGQKDVQQTYVIRRMVDDFHLNTRVRVVPTVRDIDGLAKSSRNVYLGRRRRKVATVLVRALRAVRAAFLDAHTERDVLLGAAHKIFEDELQRQEALPPHARCMFEVDYLSLADPLRFIELDNVEPKHGAILSGAVKMLPIEEPEEGEDLGTGGGNLPVRLIDNLRLEQITSMLERTRSSSSNTL
ncbi:MAG: hypothetical protein LQ350_000252 [Teloschistes chrysophthalmus]|nr:MAG: hypothetical protein LQ350_000252 [Niorma chrysophthalma]